MNKERLLSLIKDYAELHYSLGTLINKSRENDVTEEIEGVYREITKIIDSI